MVPDPSTLLAVVRAYRRGATVRALAAEHDVNESTIRYWLDKAEVSRRRRGPADGPVTDETILELLEAGASWTEIVDAVGMSRSGVRARARRIQGLPHWR